MDKRAQWSDDDMNWGEDKGPWDSTTRDAVREAIEPDLRAFLSKYDDLFDSDAGDHYLRDFDQLVDWWIQEIASTIAWAEKSGTGDVTGMETGYANDMAELLWKLDPTDQLKKQDIVYELDEAVDSVMDKGFEAAVRTVGGSLKFDQSGNYSKGLQADSIQRISSRLKTAGGNMENYYYVFLRGSSNAYNAVDSCVWAGEANSPDEAVDQAVEEGCSVYNNQYLEALLESELTDAEDSAVEEFVMEEALYPGQRYQYAGVQFDQHGRYSKGLQADSIQRIAKKLDR